MICTLFIDKPYSSQITARLLACKHYATWLGHISVSHVGKSCSDQVVMWKSVMTGNLKPQGAVSPGFNSLWRGWVYPRAPEVSLFRGIPTSPRHFWDCQGHVGFGPAPGPTLKRPCATLVHLVGRITNISSPIGMIL